MRVSGRGKALDEVAGSFSETNAIESLKMSLQAIIKNQAAFPSEKAAYKLLYLSLQSEKMDDAD